jgi:hypothetical protein
MEDRGSRWRIVEMVAHLGRAGRGDHVPAGSRHIMASATRVVMPDW